MSAWRIDPIGGGWALLLLAVLVATMLLVKPRGMQLSARRRWTLFALRAASALVLLLLMLRPAFETVTTRKLPGSLLVLIDNSRSMQVEDSLANQSRWQALRDVLGDSSEQLSELAESWDVRPYMFSEECTPVTFTKGDVVLPDAPDGPQSALGFAIEESLLRESDQRVVAMLLLSDGAQRAFAPRDTPPQTAARRLITDGVPLYTFTFGKPALGLRSDLRVGDLLTPSTAFSATPVDVSATVYADGYANQSFNVRLLWEDADGQMETVDTRRVQVRANQPQQTVRFSHTPAQPGEYKVSVEIDSPEGELIASNNSQSTFVTVIKGGVNVLQLVGASRVGGGPGIEPRFVRLALSAHADVSVDYRLFDYRSLRLNLREQIASGEHNVLLLENLDNSALDPPTWTAVANLVEEGAGLAMLGGLHSFGPGGYRSTPIQALLPVGIGPAERQKFGEPPRSDMHLRGPISVVPRALAGVVHPIMRLGEGVDPIAAWRALPPQDGVNRFDPRRIKPNAQVIAVSDDRRQAPLMVVGAYGRGRTAAVAFDSTWHWQMEGQGDTLRRFWRQLVLWLAQKDDTEGDRVWVRLDQRRYRRGSRVEFSFGATDDQGQPLPDAAIQATVHRPDGGTTEVSGVRRGEALVGSFQDSSAPGDYRVVVHATDGGVELPEAVARFIVPDVDTELDQPAAEPTLMAALAGLTAEAGGEGLAPEQFPDVLERLKERTQDFEEQITQSITLYDTWPALLTLVAIITVEWFLRKRWGMV